MTDSPVAPSPPFSLCGERVLITGANGGIGAATARLCSALGASLVLTDLAFSDTELAQLSGVEAAHSCDSTDRAGIEKIVAQHAPLTALIDTAAICPFDEDWLAPDWDQDAFTRVMRVNVLGPINLVRAVMPGMIERQRGSIVLCGSIAGWTGGLRAGPHYVASKGGIHALVRWFAQRATPHGVRVNAVAPGPIDSSMTAGQAYEPAAFPMKRMGQPDEIANALAFLASPAASFIAGSVMDVNGGVLMR